MFLGRKSKFLYAQESEYGTVNTASEWAWAGFVQSFSADDSQNLEPLNPMDGAGERTVGEHFPLVPTYGGSVELIPQHMRFASMGIGVDDYSGGTHTISVGETLPSFDIQAGYVSNHEIFGKQYSGCKIGSVDFDWAQDDFFRVSCDFRAQDVEKITTFKDYQSSTDSLQKYTSTELPPYRCEYSTFVVGGEDVSPYVTSANVSVDNDLRIDPSLDAGDNGLISEPLPQIQTPTATLSLKMRESTLWDFWKEAENNDTTSFTVAKANGTDEANFDFSKAIIEAANSPINITEGIVVQEINISAATMTLTEDNDIETQYDTISA